MTPRVIVICGQTASGKTALSVELAKRTNGEIVCADSMQVYKHLSIGTALPTQDEMQNVPHHMFAYIDPRENYSLSRYIADSTAAVDDILRRGKLPYIVGGTGLYIDTLVNNVELCTVSEDPEYRAHLFALAEEYGNAHIYNMLRTLDPKRAENMHQNNVKRVVRALEIVKNSSNKHTEPTFLTQRYNVTNYMVDISREVLYNRINARVDIMFENGLVEEVARLKAMGITLGNTCMQGIGYKEVYSHLQNEITLPEAIELVKKNTRNYAKRQQTWFKRNKSIHLINYEAMDIERIAFEINSDETAS